MKNCRNVKEFVALTMNNKTFLRTCWAQFKLNALSQKLQIVIRQFEKNKNEGCWKIILLKRINRYKKINPQNNLMKILEQFVDCATMLLANMS